MLWTIAIIPAFGAALFFALPASSRAVVGAVAAAVLALTVALAAVAAASGWTGSLAWSDTLRLGAALTPLSAAVAILVPAVALPVALYAASHEARDGLARLLGLMLVFVGAMELLVLADDFLTLLIGWELVGACSWALIGHRWYEAEPPSAALYAFVATRLGDVGLFVAAFATYAGAGSFAFSALSELTPAHLQLVAFGVLVSAAAKSGQIPFAPWLFRAMAGPTSVSALLHAATMVAAGAYLVARLQPWLSEASGFAGIAVGIGLATALAGGVVAVLQSHAKKLLAASTSAQYGLMFAAAGAGWPGLAILHLVAHAWFKALLFLSAGVAGERAGTFSLDRMGFGRALPWTAALSAVGALALAGVPPLGAAWSKEEVVAGILHANPLAGATAMLAGAISAAYAARFLMMAWYPSAEPQGGHAPGAGEIAGIALLATASIAVSFVWSPRAGEAAARLFAAGAAADALPPSNIAEKAVSLLLAGIGLVAGLQLARSRPGLGRGGIAFRSSEWLGLPSLIRAGVVRPFVRVSRLAALLDDRVLDGMPRAAAARVRAIAAGAATGDRHAFDRLPRSVAALVQALSRGASAADRRAIDRGVALVAAAAECIAAIGDRLGERVADGIPSGSGWLAGTSGRDLRLLQTGLSHHYYALFALGAAGAFILLLTAGS